ncbi:MAG TPA: zf-HC2 domain-containing protein [Candidatus Acidoferrum sp.]|nr:zf-HC2 domain-containing protein [Candidatus Acidoferrum sp.]
MNESQMSQCSQISLMLGAAGDGELEPGPLHEVAHHLTGCASCTVESSDYSTIGRELRAFATVPSLEGFTKSVLDVIAKLAIVAVLAIALHGLFPRTVPQVVASRAAAPARVARAKPMVDVQVDSAFASVANAAPVFFSHTNGRTVSGRMIVFALPGGKTLHVRPRAIVGNKIAMEVVLFDGKRTAMTADLTLESGDTFALSGEQYGDSTLLIRISPSATAPARPKSL